MTLFVFLPVATFYLGILYQNTLTPPPSLNLKADTRSDLIKRCGQLSVADLAIKLDKNNILNGPDWSPDCRHVAWSVKTLNTKTASSSAIIEGIYLFDDQTKDIKLAVSEKTPQEALTFERWKDRETFMFSRSMNGKVTSEKYSLSSMK